MTFYDFAKHQKTVSKTTFWSFQKSWTKYLIKPVVYWSFWGPFPKKALTSIKKALRFSLKRACVSAKSKNLIKPIKIDDFVAPFFRLGASTTLKTDSGPVAPKRPSRTALSPASETARVFLDRWFVFGPLDFLLDRSKKTFHIWKWHASSSRKRL